MCIRDSIAVAGFDIEKLVAGAAAMEKACGKDVPFAENPAAIYAATRNELYKNGKKIEILVNFNPKLHYVSEWWKQLYGEDVYKRQGEKHHHNAQTLCRKGNQFGIRSKNTHHPVGEEHTYNKAESLSLIHI